MMKRLAWMVSVLLLISSILTGCSEVTLYSQNELYELHDVIDFVVEKQLEYSKVIEDSLTAKLGEKMTEDMDFVDYLSTKNYDPNKPFIALTFDDGPKTDTTKEILDILEANGAKATFFVLGQNIGENTKPVLQRMVSMGCEIGNHSWDHQYQLPQLDSKGIHDQIDRTNEQILDYSGRPCRLMRPPYGSVDDNVSANVSQPMIFWDIDSLDWKTRDANKTVSIVKQNIHDGSIILMHDIHPETVEACRTLIPDLISEGYQLVTVSEMAYMKGITLEPGKRYYNMVLDEEG